MNRTEARRLAAGGAITTLGPGRARWYAHIVAALGAAAALALVVVGMWVAFTAPAAMFQ